MGTPKTQNKSDCRCTRCGAHAKHWKSELNRVGGVRCVCCGGNVVLARYVFDGDLDPEARAKQSVAPDPEAKIVTTPLRRTARPNRRQKHRKPVKRQDPTPLDREYQVIVNPEQATAAFLELVDCKPEEIKNRSVERKKPTGRKSWMNANTLVPFAPYRGKAIRNVPRSFLEWLAAQPATDKSTRRSEGFKVELRRYLKSTG